MLLSDKYPFLTEYFTALLNSPDKPLPQSLLFYGSDFESQYSLALEIARLLNCRENKEDSCECLNCKWIRENTHPAVLTISKTDNKPEDDDSKTVISIKQSAMIKNQLVNASEFHRVYIFCGRDEDNRISGLNALNFQDEAANSLLKIIEEPQQGVTFIFITRFIEDVLPTIASRSQCFFVPARAEVDFDYSEILGVFENYWEFERRKVFDVSQQLTDLAGTISATKVLEKIQNYMLYLLKANPKNLRFLHDIEIAEECKKMLRQGLKAANVFDDFCLNVIV